MTLHITNVRLPDTTGPDAGTSITISGSEITAIGDPGPPDSKVVDGAGGIAIPTLVDAHAHLDSTRLGLPFRPHTAEPSLAGLVENDRRHWRNAEKPVGDRATHTLGATIASGATFVRSHAQVDPDSGLERLEGVLAARETHADRATVEVVAFPQAGIIRSPGTVDLLESAMDAGADLIGGIDPAGFDRDPVKHLDVVFGIAERKGVGIDIHLHDGGTLGAFQIELICERTKAAGLGGQVAISHCFGLSTVDSSTTERLVELLADSGVSVTTVAPATRPPLPLVDLSDADIPMGLGQDGIRDYWSPYGDGDMLGRTWQLAFTNGFRRDDLIERCVEVATNGGRRVMGFEPVMIAVGEPADIVIVQGDTLVAAVMDRAPRTVVINDGAVVARDNQLV